MSANNFNQASTAPAFPFEDLSIPRAQPGMFRRFYTGDFHERQEEGYNERAMEALFGEPTTYEYPEDRPTNAGIFSKNSPNLSLRITRIFLIILKKFNL